MEHLGLLAAPLGRGFLIAPRLRDLLKRRVVLPDIGEAQLLVDSAGLAGGTWACSGVASDAYLARAADAARPPDLRQ